ncbi:MAG: class I SAM-dependent methyltransferase, partial [Armatimonadetes bacterium]|nr:class I SAM-dependent methyltransferase [Armatimonadota bacterium]
MRHREGGRLGPKGLLDRDHGGEVKIKYYYRQHLQGYARIRAEGKTAWTEIHDGKGFDEFPSRPFLESVLPRLAFDVEEPSDLEYGCGTGPGACFLAERGFRVDAVDLILAAIEIARTVAARRGLAIRYEVMDVCDLPARGQLYDLIVDSYCLQGIVFDPERQKVFAAARSRLRPKGYYLVSTAFFDEKRFRAGETVRDERAGILYHRYRDDGLIDPETGLVYLITPEKPEGFEPVERIAGLWLLPIRRHRKPEGLRAELEGAGFRVLFQDGGHFVCA